MNSVVPPLRMLSEITPLCAETTRIRSGVDSQELAAGGDSRSRSVSVMFSSNWAGPVSKLSVVPITAGP